MLFISNTPHDSSQGSGYVITLKPSILYQLHPSDNRPASPNLVPFPARLDSVWPSNRVSPLCAHLPGEEIAMNFMADQNVYFFVHIPKTAGTSIRKHLLYPNVSEKNTGHCYGLKDLLRSNWGGVRWLEGHHPYGIHQFMRGLEGRPTYFTMLREPLKRAVSFYYFLRDAKSESYEHPRHSDAMENDIASFYKLPRYQNVQTRFIAGVIWHRLNHLSRASTLANCMLRVAKKNLLEKFDCFGLTERHDQSLELFAKTFDWNYTTPKSRVKPTTDRPSVSDLDSHERNTIREANRLDSALYQFAVSHFDAQQLVQ